MARPPTKVTPNLLQLQVHHRWTYKAPPGERPSASWKTGGSNPGDGMRSSVMGVGGGSIGYPSEQMIV